MMTAWFLAPMLHCTLLPDWRALVTWSANKRKDSLGDANLW